MNAVSPGSPAWGQASAASDLVRSGGMVSDHSAILANRMSDWKVINVYTKVYIHISRLSISIHIPIYGIFTYICHKKSTKCR